MRIAIAITHAKLIKPSNRPFLAMIDSRVNPLNGRTPLASALQYILSASNLNTNAVNILFYPLEFMSKKRSSLT